MTTEFTLIEILQEFKDRVEVQDAMIAFIEGIIKDDPMKALPLQIDVLERVSEYE